MEQPTTIGIDLAKSIFQVHGVSVDGPVVLRRQLRRGQVLTFFSRLDPCLIGMEACSGAHHWARELSALGHEVRLMPAAYVKPYVKRGKTDRADAEAICEAVTRPTMRFVPVKSAEAQAALLDHKARDFLIRQQTQTVNTIRAHLAEFGIVVAKGIQNVDRLLAAAEQTPEAARPALDLLAGQLRDLRARIETVTARIEAAQKSDPLARRLATIPGLGPIASSAFAVTTPDVAAFRSARDYSAWLGLTPKPHSSGGKERLGRILEGWKPLPATPALPRRHGADRRPAPRTTRDRLALEDAGEKACEGGGHRPGQPDGAGRLGARQERRKLPGSPGLTEHAGADRLRDGEARREVMATGRRNGNRDTLFEPKHLRVRAIDRDPSAGGLHQGAQLPRCTSDAVHMAATDQTQPPNSALAPREPSTHGSSNNVDGRPSAVCTTPRTNWRATPPTSLFMPKARRSSATSPSPWMRTVVRS